MYSERVAPFLPFCLHRDCKSVFRIFSHRDMSKIAIVGGGIIGLSTAYYLQREGHDITVFDRGDLSESCSIGNAGMIVPSHIIPLAAPGMIAKGIRWMFDASSPFY